MAERDSWAVQATGPTGMLDVEEARVALGALWFPSASPVKALSGFRPGPGTSPGLVTASATPDANVNVAPFQAVIQTGRGAVGGTYLATLDATKTVDILAAHPANATNPRNDLIIAQQSDTFYGDGSSGFLVQQVVGTPSGTPVDPTVTGSADYITLARVRVNASATTITSGNITDLRPTQLYTVAVGGILPVPSSTARNALSGIYPGMAVYRTDRAWIEIYDGTAWRVQGVAQVVSTGDLAAISSPYTGQVALNSGNSTMLRYTGAAWVEVVDDLWQVGATTATATVSAETVVLTAPSSTYRAHRAYLLRLRGYARSSTATGIMVLQVRDTNAAGTIRATVNVYIPLAGTNVSYDITVEVANTTGADITGRVLVLTIAGTNVLINGGAMFPSLFGCRPNGVDTSHPQAVPL